MSRPSWWEDVVRIPPPKPKPKPPPRPEPEWVEPSWAAGLPERDRLLMAFVSGAWFLRCTRCGRDLRARHRRHDQVRSDWYYHVSTGKHARTVLWTEFAFLGFQTDKVLARSVAEALRAGFDRARAERNLTAVPPPA